ncbi:nuclear pore complex protein Nup88-like [Uranotaenia lowii]|uniref:nuclear pore complex protein Nup88-like n=1 Tax=Uranotaenia lowii TaxID=190385 RepID=UPI0024796FE6|nr:nuclear pore complex protein Nup88-like [Uranotaenia lowii]
MLISNTSGGVAGSGPKTTTTKANVSSGSLADGGENSVTATPSSAKLVVDYLGSLGDTAVDFDIAPPRVVANCGSDVRGRTSISSSSNRYVSGSKRLGGTSNEQQKVEWPIVILRGDGNVYILCAGIDSDRPKLQGPLSILPQVNDNYGLDSCSLVVVPSLPPTIIIAESNGKTHHALMLEVQDPEERSFTELDSSLVIYPCEWYLQVLETVELELGLTGVDETRSYSCPIHLKKDLLNESRYFAYHNAGLHAITLDFTRQLSQFVESLEDTTDKYPLFNTHSNAEYVVCTKAFQSKNSNPILGFALLQSPSGHVLQLASGQVVSLDLIADHSMIRDIKVQTSAKSSNGTDSPLRNLLKDSFQDRIQSILKSGTTQPILKLDKSTEPSAQESFELLTQATRMLREHYFVKHEKARQEIARRVHVLKLLKEQQLDEISQLQLEKQEIREKAERLAENYEDICDKQSALFKRAQEVVRLATLRLPKGSFSEKTYAEMIDNISRATKKLQKNVDLAKQKITTQQVQIEQKQKSENERIVSLPSKQEEIIKHIISEMYVQIEGHVNDIKKANNILNLA